MERQIRKNIPPLANTTDFQFGFKIRCASRVVCIAHDLRRRHEDYVWV